MNYEQSAGIQCSAGCLRSRLSFTHRRSATSRRAYPHRPPWSNEILAEVRIALTEELVLDPQAANDRLEAMRMAFRDAKVNAYQALIPAMKVDIGDRHVAAAVVARAAQVIVSLNLMHFPPMSPTM